MERGCEKSSADPVLSDMGEESRRGFRLLRDILSEANPDADRGDLTEWQFKRIYRVDSMADWDKVLRRLAPAVEDVPMLGVEVHGEPEPTEVLVADYRLHCAILDLERLEGTECPLEAEEKAIPRDLKRWLADPGVIIVTSAEDVRLRRPPHCLKITSVVSSRTLFEAQTKSGLIRHATRDDLGGQLDWALKSWSRLSEQTRNVCQPYKYGHGPAFHDFDRFYRTIAAIAFVEGVALKGLEDGSVAHLSCAGPLGSTLVHWLSHYTLKSDGKVEPTQREHPDAGLHCLSQYTLKSDADFNPDERESPDAGNSSAADEIETLGNGVDRWLEESRGGCRSAEVRGLDGRRREVDDLCQQSYRIRVTEKSVLQAAKSLTDCWGQGRHVALKMDVNMSKHMKLLELGDATVAVAATSEKRPVVDDPYRQTNAIATEKGIRLNPFLTAPKFFGVCTFCGQERCSKYAIALNGLQIENCPSFRARIRGRRNCDFIRCHDPTSHVTAVCPGLHGRCLRCGCRGHTSRDRCDPEDEEISWRLRDEFERWADRGRYTRTRRSSPVWGWYPPVPNAEVDKYVDYSLLSSLPARQSLAMVTKLRKATDGERNCFKDE